MGFGVDPPLCCGTSQGKMWIVRQKAVGGDEKIVGNIGEAGERELVRVVSVRCGKERDKSRV